MTNLQNRDSSQIITSPLEGEGHSQSNLINDKLHEECGIFGGCSNSIQIAPIIKEGLLRLQHRGQESSGICTGAKFQTLHKNIGLVKDVFKNLPSNLTGNFGIGHVRYSTQGKSDAKNAQPILINNISISHNGNIRLQSRMGFSPSESDSEFILKKIIETCDDFSFRKIGTCLEENFSLGAYSLALFLPEKILAYRDSHGFRPLFFCEAKEGFFIASEDVAFENLNPIKIIEIQAGFGVEITADSYEIKKFAESLEEKKCVFEPIYFSSPKSHVFGMNIEQARQNLGKILAQNDNIKADIVVPVPQSGFAAALGYSTQSQIPLKEGFLLNDTNRSFIQPTQESRIEKVQNKLAVISSAVVGKKIILVDDSIVRGTTSKEIIKMLRTCGAKEVHLRLSSPMIINTCFWGVDIPNHDDLLAYSKTEEEIAQEIGADSVKFLKLKDLKEFFGQNGWCYNCFMAKNETSKSHTELVGTLTS